MYRRSFYCVLFIYAVATAGCVKRVDEVQKKVSALPDVTVKAVGGTDQTADAGSALVDSVVIKINEPGSTLNKFFVQIFQQTLCNGDSVSERTVVNNSTLSFKWKLSSKVGQQTLQFKILDNSRKTVDSLKVTATALPPAKGWHTGQCIIPYQLEATCFSKFSNGRLMAGEEGNFDNIYSDDNGVTWHTTGQLLKGAYLWTLKTAVLSTDEVFASTVLDGVYYSADKGMTWQKRSINMPLLPEMSHVYAMPNDKLICTNRNGGIYLSANKGLNWTVASAEAPGKQQCEYVGVAANGDIYLNETNIYNDGILKKLDPATFAISTISNVPVIVMGSAYLDAAGTLFVGGFEASTNSSVIYEQAVGDTKWTKIFAYPYTSRSGNLSYNVFNISKQPDGNYYFVVGIDANVIYYKTADLKTFYPLTSATYTGINYIVAANGYFVVNGTSNVRFYVP